MGCLPANHNHAFLQGALESQYFHLSSVSVGSVVNVTYIPCVCAFTQSRASLSQILSQLGDSLETVKGQVHALETVKGRVHACIRQKGGGCGNVMEFPDRSRQELLSPALDQLVSQSTGLTRNGILRCVGHVRSCNE